MRRQIYNRLLLVCLSSLFVAIGIHEVIGQSRYSRLHEHVLESDGFRRQTLDEKMQNFIQTTEDPGKFLGLYWLETGFGQEKYTGAYTEDAFFQLEKVWGMKKEWQDYLKGCEAVWNDLKYFPVPEASGGLDAQVSFEDSWMYERNYGGKRGHEGTDIMPSIDESGLYPVVSMTDGVVLHKGWLEQGGYRIGITAPGGGYFYYAHLDSYADVEIGDAVKAGDLLGFMGDTGYSKVEGTTGNFPVHLHVGIYLVQGEKEISVNPYPALCYLEGRKIKCRYDGTIRR